MALILLEASLSYVIVSALLSPIIQRLVRQLCLTVNHDNTCILLCADTSNCNAGQEPLVCGLWSDYLHSCIHLLRYASFCGIPVSFCIRTYLASSPGSLNAGEKKRHCLRMRQKAPEIWDQSRKKLSLMGIHISL